MKQSFISDRTSTNSKTQETIDELDTLTDVDDHLQFATQVIQRDDIPDAVRGKIDQQINHIQKRKQRFEQLENLVISRLSRERSLAISENVLRLLTRLFEQLDGHLRSQWEQYKQRQAAIEQETIPDLASFTAQEQGIYQHLLDDAISTTMAKVSHCVEEYREKTISQIRSAIFDAQALSALEGVVKTEAEAILKQAQQNLQTELQHKTEKISQPAKKASRQFDSKFTEAYSRLEALAGRVEIQSTVNDGFQLNTSDVFASMQELRQEMDSKDSSIAMGGLAAGAVIGSAILPIVGKVVGGFIGFIASAGIFSSLDKRKQQLWEKLRPSLDSYFDALNGKGGETPPLRSYCGLPK